MTIRNLHKGFGEFEVLNGITFDVMKGNIVCMIRLPTGFALIPHIFPDALLAMAADPKQPNFGGVCIRAAIRRRSARQTVHRRRSEAGETPSIRHLARGSAPRPNAGRKTR